jgi:cytochrome c553
MKKDGKTGLVLAAFTLALLAVAAAFHFNLWARPPKLPEIPLVDTNFLSTATARVSAAELFATPGADTSDFDCYVCHEKGKPPTIRYDNKGQIIIPTEHKDIVLGHGTHGRNNNCFNCHNETNLVTLQTRDGRELKITDSPSLCGSCHGPTFRDWEAGVHGRTGGFWDTKLGEITFKPCTACHDPHHPKFPGRKPAPGPHPLHPQPEVKTTKET